MVSSQDLTGIIVSITNAFLTVVPFGIILITTGLAGFIALFIGDYVLLAVAICSGLIGGLVAGFINDNSKTAGAMGGLLTAFSVSGFYLIYSGGLLLTFVTILESMDVVIFALSILVLALVMALYTRGKKSFLCRKASPTL